MTIEKIRKVHQARPFQPFALHMADGRSVHVSRPETLFVPPTAERTIIAATSEDDFEIIDLLLVTSIEIGKRQARRRRRTA